MLNFEKMECPICSNELVYIKYDFNNKKLDVFSCDHCGFSIADCANITRYDNLNPVGVIKTHDAKSNVTFNTYLSLFVFESIYSELEYIVAKSDNMILSRFNYDKNKIEIFNLKNIY